MFLKDENESIINYFSKFEGKEKFDELNDELKKLSEFKYIGDMILGDMIIPNVGPSEKLKKFHIKIKRIWGDQAGTKVKYVNKYFTGDPVENIEELMTILDIVICEEDNKEKFVILKDDLINNRELDMEFIIELLSSSNIIYTSIATFITTILDQ